MSTPIKDKMEAKLEKDYNAPLTYTPQPNMRPSFLGTPCLRKIYYHFLRVPQDYGWTVPRIKNFERGEAYGTLLRKWMRATFEMIDYRGKNGKIPLHWKTKEPDPEFPVNAPDLNIKNAKVDDIGIVRDVEGLKDGLQVFEYKSINDKGFNRYLDDGPKKEHLQQGMIYAFLLEQNLQDGAFSHIPELDGYTEINGVIFIYLNRESDTEDWREFHIEKDSEPFVNVIEKIMKTKAHIEEGTLPAKTEDFCNWCELREKCKADYKPK